MKTTSPLNTWKIRDLAARALHRLDPRTVRVRDPGPRVGIWIGAATVGVALVAGAAALAASQHDDPAAEPERRPTTGGADRRPSAPQRVSRAAASAPTAAPAPEHARFHDPIYVFTDDPVKRASAYPLADPPGLVVDLDGLPEPARPPAELVGEDPRIRSVRRRVTAKGLRYIIGLETPVKRLQVVHEGNVVIVTPLR